MSPTSAGPQSSAANAATGTLEEARSVVEYMLRWPSPGGINPTSDAGVALQTLLRITAPRDPAFWRDPMTGALHTHQADPGFEAGARGKGWQPLFDSPPAAPQRRPGWALVFSNERDFCLAASPYIGAAYTDGRASVRRINVSPYGVQTFGPISAAEPSTDASQGLSPDDATSLAGYLSEVLPRLQKRPLAQCGIYGRPAGEMIEALRGGSPSGAVHAG